MIEVLGSNGLTVVIAIVVVAVASLFSLVIFASKEEKFEDVVAAQKKEQEALLQSLNTTANKPSKSKEEWAKIKIEKSSEAHDKKDEPAAAVFEENVTPDETGLVEDLAKVEVPTIEVQALAEKAPKKANNKKKENAAPEVSEGSIIKAAEVVETHQEPEANVEEEIIEAIQDVAGVAAELLPKAERDEMQNLTNAMAAVQEWPGVKELKHLLRSRGRTESDTVAAPTQKQSKNKKAKSAVAGGIEQDIIGNGMKLLQPLVRMDEINKDHPEKWKTILGEISNNLDDCQNSWKESKEITVPINIPGLTTVNATITNTESFGERNYPMNNKPHGLCVIISNKDFQSGAEIVGKEKGKPAAEEKYSMEIDFIKQTQAQSLSKEGRNQQLEPYRPGNEAPENIAAQSENFISGSENAPSSAPHVAAQSQQSENLTTTTTTLHTAPEDKKDQSNFTMQPEDEMTEHATATQENDDMSLEDVTIEMDDSEFNRKGTEVDEEQLHQTFDWLNFKVVPIPNCTGQEMRSKLKAISELDHKNYDAFVCCILSHGYEDGVYGIDFDTLQLSEIRKMFTGERCKGLLDKPKIFFFQACRGSNIDIGSLKSHKATESEYTVMSSAVPLKDQAVGFDSGHIQGKKEPSKKIERTVHPNDCDFLFAQAATKGNKALRHVEKGSWFISTVCEVLRKEAHKKDLLHMMTTVKRHISNKTNYDMGRYKCAPESTDNLSKDLRFKVEETWEDYRERNGIGN